MTSAQMHRGILGKLTKFVISHARFTWLLVISTFLGGVYVYLNQPRQEDPEITLRSAQVVTRFPGLSPERIEQLVTRPIEEAIKTISEIENIKSISMTGMSIVTPETYDRYEDMSPIWTELRNKMSDLAPQLPSGTDGPHVNDDYGRIAVITMALTGRDFSMAELYDEARTIRDELNTLPLVASVDLYGAQQERIWIEFNPASMSQFQIDPSMIVTSLNGQNVVMPGGTVEAGWQNIVIEPSGDFKSIDDIRFLPIATKGEHIIYLEDLAAIHRSYVDPPVSPVFYNGQEAIVLGISMVTKSNVVKLGNQITDQLVEIRSALPLGMDLDIVICQPDLVQESVRNASVNLMQTVVVVMVVVMVFLGLRTGLIVGSMIPMTMMTVLIGMAILGIELHRISIAAIIVALGLLVDNGVVIAEDIRKRIDEGSDWLDAVLKTPESLSIPLLTSSSTTVAAFLPLMLTKGGSGEFLKSLGQVITIALLSSWLISITIIPAFCYWFLGDLKKNAEKKVSKNDNVDRYDTKVYRFYRNVLNIILRFRVGFILIMLAVLYSSFFIFSFVKRRSLGPSERNQFTVYLDLPSEATIRETISATQQLINFLTEPTQNPEVKDVLAYIGSGGPRFFLALAPNDPQPNKAFLVVNTEKAEQIDVVMDSVNRYIIEKMPQAIGWSDILFLGHAPLGTVEIRITGPEIDMIRNLGSQVMDVFHSLSGTQGIRSDWENSVLKLCVQVDQERARRAGISSKEIAQTLSAYFDGTDVTVYREGDKVIPVTIRAQADARATLDLVRTVEVYSSARMLSVPLIQIADFDGTVETSHIRRYNQKRALTVAGKHPEMTAVELYQAMKTQLDSIQLPIGYEFELEGEIKGARESNQKLFKFAPLAMFIILSLLILQFNSFRRAAVILLTIPLVLIGAGYGLFIFRGYFDFTAMLGLFSLAGIIINNGIVMIDRIDQQRAKGLPVNEAVIDAAMVRARPIIMTTVTTVVGLIPLALFGGEFWYGMAIVIICGLGVGTVLTLAFVPVLYSLLFGGTMNFKPKTIPIEKKIDNPEKKSD